jgi:hypothetical protein
MAQIQFRMTLPLLLSLNAGFLRLLIFVVLDLALLPEIFLQLVEQATDGPRKGLNPPPALR